MKNVSENNKSYWMIGQRKEYNRRNARRSRGGTGFETGKGTVTTRAMDAAKFSYKRLRVTME